MYEQYVDVFPSSGVVVTRLEMGVGRDGGTFGHAEVAEGVRNALPLAGE